MPARFPLLVILLTALCLDAASHTPSGTLELNGQVEEVATAVRVRIYGTESPFTAFTTTNTHGRFRFRSLQAGTYIVSAFVRGRGEARRTVVVTPSLADPKGVVHASIPLPPRTSSVDRARRRSMVSVTQLSISDAARQKFADAQRALTKRDIERATAHLQEAVALAPKFTEGWNSLGVIYYQTHDFTNAERCFRSALAADPGSFTPTVNLGGALLNLNRPKDALDYNKFAVKTRPNDALANSQLGINYFKLGQLEKAEEYLTAAERLDPSHFSHPQLMLAEIYARKGDKSSTLRELNDFIARFPDSPVSADLRKNSKP